MHFKMTGAVIISVKARLTGTLETQTLFYADTMQLVTDQVELGSRAQEQCA